MTTMQTLNDTRNDLALDTRGSMVELLNQQLADMFDLYSQTKQAHWNVKGMQFQSLHELFDELAGDLLAQVDMVAERATALGGVALGTVRMAGSASRLADASPDVQLGKDWVELLAERYGAVAKTTRAASTSAAEAGDDSTADLFTEVSRSLDKQLWFIEAHLG